MRIMSAGQGLTTQEKVAVLKERLAFLLRHPEAVYRLNTREASDTGRRYTDEAMDAGEVLNALARCSLRQQRILRLWLGRQASTQSVIASTIGVSVSTVRRDAAAALQRMAAQVWEE